MKAALLLLAPAARHDRRQACKTLHTQRETRRCAMPKRIPPEIQELIRSLLLSGKTQAEVRDILRDKGIVISSGPIGKIAFVLAHEGRLDLSVRRPRAGMRLGRPIGSTDAARGRNRIRTSEHWSVVEQMIADGKSDSEIAEALELTRQRVWTMRKRISDGTEKK